MLSRFLTPRGEADAPRAQPARPAPEPFKPNLAVRLLQERLAGVGLENEPPSAAPEVPDTQEPAVADTQEPAVADTGHPPPGAGV